MSLTHEPALETLLLFAWSEAIKKSARLKHHPPLIWYLDCDSAWCALCVGRASFDSVLQKIGSSHALALPQSGWLTLLAFACQCKNSQLG